MGCVDRKQTICGTALVLRNVEILVTKIWPWRVTYVVLIYLGPGADGRHLSELDFGRSRGEKDGGPSAALANETSSPPEIIYC
jgi:hypothetical protein